MSTSIEGWPDCIILTIPGDPVSKGRPRVYNGHGVTPSSLAVSLRATGARKKITGTPTT